MQWFDLDEGYYETASQPWAQSFSAAFLLIAPPVIL